MYLQILTYDIGIALTCASQKSIRPSILYIYTIYLSTVAFHRLVKQKNTNHQQFYLIIKLGLYIYMVHRMAYSEISLNIIFPNQVMFHSTLMVFGRRFLLKKKRFNHWYLK